MKAHSIPRLKLPSARLPKLINSVSAALKDEIKFKSLACFTNSELALRLIREIKAVHPEPDQ